MKKGPFHVNKSATWLQAKYEPPISLPSSKREVGWGIPPPHLQLVSAVAKTTFLCLVSLWFNLSKKLLTSCPGQGSSLSIPRTNGSGSLWYHSHTPALSPSYPESPKQNQTNRVKNMPKLLFFRFVSHRGLGFTLSRQYYCSVRSAALQTTHWGGPGPRVEPGTGDLL